MRLRTLTLGPARHSIFLALLLAAALAPAYAATNYTVSLASPEQHLVQVQIMLPEGAAHRELQLPVWNALYQVRDFAQYVNWVRAKDPAGRTLVVREADKSRWQIDGAQAGAVIEYQIYVDSPGPFGAQLNSHHAFFNLAQIRGCPERAGDRAFQPGSRRMARGDAIDVTA
jgi:predicted metalloprotease with PDZ domain